MKKHESDKSEMTEMFELMKEYKRKQRNNSFEQFKINELLQLEAEHDVSFNPDMCRYTIDGKYDYYPKSKRLLVRASNNWFRNGLDKLFRILNMKR